MNTLNLSVAYRPLKFGWCVTKDDFSGFTKAVNLTHTLWGGRYNPIIVIDEQEPAKMLVNTFKVDALYQISEGENVDEFIQKFEYLRWPNIHKHFFIDGSNKFYSNFVDVFHPINLIYKDHVKNVEKPKLKVNVFDWSVEDPLNFVLLSTSGKFTKNEYILKDYTNVLEDHLPIEKNLINLNDKLPNNFSQLFTINELCNYGLVNRRFYSVYGDGFYFGKVNDFQDIVNYWNLRASNLDVQFFDPEYMERLEGMRTEHINSLNKTIKKNRNYGNDKINIWYGKNFESKGIRNVFDLNFDVHKVNHYLWNGLNLRTPVINTTHKTALASIDTEEQRIAVSFQIPDSQFTNKGYEHTQKVVLKVQPSFDVDYYKLKGQTIFTPNIPQLNDYYSGKFRFALNEVRVDDEGLGIIIDVLTDTIYLSSLSVNDLVFKIFNIYGFDCEVSQPGLKASRVIQQMGGLQGCRVFKIPGARELIQNVRFNQTLTRSNAIQTIRKFDPITKEADFTLFEDLYIEQRNKAKLTPVDVLNFLSLKGVFRVGLNLKCPNCQLISWIHLDSIRTISTCEYCGYEFNLTNQLQDRDWAYRPSGLFALNDNQEGSIPVVLTLQQLNTTIRDRFAVYVPGLKVKSKIKKLKECELDFVYLSQGFGGKPQMALAECKTNKEITVDDVINLKFVADSISNQVVDVFIIFSKLAPFTEAEIEYCKKAQDIYRFRVIMLTARELEPYFLYERTEKEFDISTTAISFADLARVTNDIYFNPKTKK